MAGDFSGTRCRQYTGRIDRIISPFGFHSTAMEVIDGVDLEGRRAIVTGATSGIGLETARALAAAGAALTLAVRDVPAGERVAAALAASRGRRVEVRPLDLGDRASVARFAADWQGAIHILVNNAGIMAPPDRLTAEGWDRQFAINHLGHFALTIALAPALADGGARIVSVSSSSHQVAPLDFEDLHFARRAYDPIAAYAQSKTANALFAVGATLQWAHRGVTANAVMPGAVRTNLQRFAGRMRTDPALLKTPAQGAATTVFTATSPRLEGIGGRYFADCNEARIVPVDQRDLTTAAAHGLDPAAAERLWTESLRLWRSR